MNNRHDLLEEVQVRRGDVLMLVAAARYAENRRTEAGNSPSKALAACLGRMELLLPVQTAVPVRGGTDEPAN